MVINKARLDALYADIKLHNKSIGEPYGADGENVPDLPHSLLAKHFIPTNAGSTYCTAYGSLCEYHAGECKAIFNENAWQWEPYNA